MRQRVEDDVDAHIERGLALGRRVVVDVGVLPAVAQVRVVGVEDDHPALVEDGVTARRAAVVLVDFREAAGEIVEDVIYIVVGRQLDERAVRERRPHSRRQDSSRP